MDIDIAVPTEQNIVKTQQKSTQIPRTGISLPEHNSLSQNTIIYHSTQKRTKTQQVR